MKPTGNCITPGTSVTQHGGRLRSLFNTIGPNWICETFEVREDTSDVDGANEEELELWYDWYRDPIECIKELIGNPMFSISYRPQRVFTSSRGTKRIYDEMWTADWWWETQVGAVQVQI